MPCDAFLEQVSLIISQHWIQDGMKFFYYVHTHPLIQAQLFHNNKHIYGLVQKLILIYTAYPSIDTHIVPGDSFSSATNVATSLKYYGAFRVSIFRSYSI